MSSSRLPANSAGRSNGVPLSSVLLYAPCRSGSPHAGSWRCPRPWWPWRTPRSEPAPSEPQRSRQRRTRTHPPQRVTSGDARSSGTPSSIPCNRHYPPIPRDRRVGRRSGVVFVSSRFRGRALPIRRSGRTVSHLNDSQMQTDHRLPHDSRWMTDSQWTVGPEEAGTQARQVPGRSRPPRLARARRRGDRARQGLRERRRSHTRATAPTRLAAGDAVRVWMDRPGSAKRPSAARPSRREDLHIVYEDDALLVVNKPAGLLAVPLERRAGRAVGLRPDRGAPAPARQAAAVRRPPHRSRHVRAGRLREGCRARSGAASAVQAARARARVSGGGLRPSGSARRAPGAIGWCGTRTR